MGGIPRRNPNAQQQVEEIYIWAKEFLKVNEDFKEQHDVDIVALEEGARSGARWFRQVRILGMLGWAYMKTVGEKDYVIFKGLPGSRPSLPGTRYLASNPIVAKFVVGTRDTLKEVKSGVKIAIVAFVALDVLQEICADHFSINHLLGNVISDIGQAAVSCLAGALASIAVGAVVGVFTVAAAPVVALFLVGLVVSFGVGMYLQHLDNKYHFNEMIENFLKTSEAWTTSVYHSAVDWGAGAYRGAVDWGTGAYHGTLKWGSSAYEGVLEWNRDGQSRAAGYVGGMTGSHMGAQFGSAVRDSKKPAGYNDDIRFLLVPLPTVLP